MEQDPVKAFEDALRTAAAPIHPHILMGAVEEAIEDLEEQFETIILKTKDLLALARKLKTQQPIAGQIQHYLLPSLKAFLEDENQTGSLVALTRMLDAAKAEVE